MSTNTPIQNTLYETQGYEIQLTAERIEALLKALDTADATENITGNTLDDLNAIINAIKEWDMSDNDLSVKDQLMKIYKKMLSEEEFNEAKKELVSKDALEKITLRVVDDLTKTDTKNPLSANQGRVLNDKIDDVKANITYNTLNFGDSLDNLQDGKYYILPSEKVINYTFDNPDTSETERAYIYAGGEIIADSTSSVPRGSGGNVLYIPNNVKGEQYMFGGNDWWAHGADIVQDFTDGVLEFNMCLCGFTSDIEYFTISPQHKGDRIGISFVKNPSGDGVLVRMPQTASAYSGASTEFVVDDATWHNYKIEYKPTVNKVNFYIDNVLVYSKTDYKGVIRDDGVTVYKQMPKYFSLYVNTEDDGGGEILIDSVMIYNTTGIDNLGLDEQCVLYQKSVGDKCVQFKITTTNDNIVCSKRTKSLHGVWGRWIDDVALDTSGKIPTDNLPNIPLNLLPNMPIHFGKMSKEAVTLTELPENSLIMLHARDDITVNITGVTTATLTSDTFIFFTGGRGDDAEWADFVRSMILYTDSLLGVSFKTLNAVVKNYGSQTDNTGITISCPANTYRGYMGNNAI